MICLNLFKRIPAREGPRILRTSEDSKVLTVSSEVDFYGCLYHTFKMKYNI